MAVLSPRSDVRYAYSDHDGSVLVPEDLISLIGSVSEPYTGVLPHIPHLSPMNMLVFALADLMQQKIGRPTVYSRQTLEQNLLLFLQNAKDQEHRGVVTVTARLNDTLPAVAWTPETLEGKDTLMPYGLFPLGFLHQLTASQGITATEGNIDITMSKALRLLGSSMKERRTSRYKPPHRFKVHSKATPEKDYRKC